MEDRKLYKTIDDFQPKELIQLSKQKPVVSVFTSTGSGSTYLLDRFLDELSNEYAEKFIFFRLDMDRVTEKVEAFNIVELPTTLIIKDGEIVEHFVGIIPKRKIRRKLDQIRN